MCDFSDTTCKYRNVKNLHLLCTTHVFFEQEKNYTMKTLLVFHESIHIKCPQVQHTFKLANFLSTSNMEIINYFKS